jgi:hypothetical protein
MRVNDESQIVEFPNPESLDEGDESEDALKPTFSSGRRAVRKLSLLTQFTFAGLFIILLCMLGLWILSGNETLPDEFDDSANLPDNFFPSIHHLEAKKIKDKYYDQIDRESNKNSETSGNVLFVGITVEDPTNFLLRQMVRTHQIKPYNESFNS